MTVSAIRLGINAVRLTRPFTGVGRALECVLDEWSRMDLPFERVTLYAPTQIDPARVVFPLDRYHCVVGGPRGPDPWWEARFLTPRAREMDVLYAPSYTIPYAYPGRSVVFYLGPAANRPLSFERLRAAAYDRLYRYSARKASRVITCSGIVKRRVVGVYGVPEERVSVAFLAPSRLFAPVREAGALAGARARLGVGEAPFTLFVGKLSHRHSIPELIAAFASARRTCGAMARHRLVLVGPCAIPLDVPRLAREAGAGDVVIHHPFVPHADLPAMYSAAEEVVFPVTEAEGFGLPVIEAMACAAPVLSAAQGSIPEFATNAALLVPSSSVDHLAEGLVRLAERPELRRELGRKGLERASSITWRATAETILRDLVAVARGTDPALARTAV